MGVLSVAPTTTTTASTVGVLHEVNLAAPVVPSAAPSATSLLQARLETGVPNSEPAVMSPSGGGSVGAVTGVMVAGEAVVLGESGESDEGFGAVKGVPENGDGPLRGGVEGGSSATVAVAVGVGTDTDTAGGDGGDGSGGSDGDGESSASREGEASAVAAADAPCSSPSSAYSDAADGGGGSPDTRASGSGSGSNGGVGDVDASSIGDVVGAIDSSGIDSGVVSDIDGSGGGAGSSGDGGGGSTTESELPPALEDSEVEVEEEADSTSAKLTTTSEEEEEEEKQNGEKGAARLRGGALGSRARLLGGRGKLWASLPSDVVAAVLGVVEVSELQVRLGDRLRLRT